MKRIAKNRLNIKKITYRVISSLVIIALIISASIKMTSQPVLADQYDDKINELKNQIALFEAESARLSEQAKTLQNAVDQLSAQKAAIQAQLAISQNEYDQLVSKIAETEKKIQDNKDALGVTIADMYIGDDITPLEMLASSKNISEYLDAQEYRSSVRDELTTTIAEIKDLKKSLEIQKAEVEVVIANQTQQRETLAAKEAEQQSLLSQTMGSEAAYQNLISSSEQQIQAARAEQAAYYASLSSQSSSVLLEGDPNKGGYPSRYANSPQDSLVDAWGMYNRECVSYAAWKVHQNYGNMPYWGGIGNAWEWGFSGWKGAGGKQVNYNNGNWHTANYITYGIPAGTEPKVGSIAVSNGTYGHVAWVEAVNGNKITISQYNWYVAELGGWGQYSMMVVDKSIFQMYIYFGEW